MIGSKRLRHQVLGLDAERTPKMPEKSIIISTCPEMA
jgi:hypothetical protein